jgi:hypothetical protein
VFQVKPELAGPDYLVKITSFFEKSLAVSGVALLTRHFNTTQPLGGDSVWYDYQMLLKGLLPMVETIPTGNQ